MSVEKETVHPVISVRNVSMEFRMPRESSDSLKEYLIRGITRQYSLRTLKALSEVSFDVFPGQVVGIVGSNGSGKSTLLKIISGAMPPTGGQVIADRDQIHLLTLGCGFDRELTARENVYLNAALLGYGRQEIADRYPQIVKFAQLEGFMDQKIKNFSSGMVSRLGFAIATARELPGVLILDEILSVGDAFFRKKSEEKIRRMIRGGTAVLLVSHSVSAVLGTCSRVLWLEKGKLMMDGEPRQVCDAYLAYGRKPV